MKNLRTVLMCMAAALVLTPVTASAKKTPVEPIDQTTLIEALEGVFFERGTAVEWVVANNTQVVVKTSATVAGVLVRFDPATGQFPPIHCGVYKAYNLNRLSERGKEYDCIVRIGAFNNGWNFYAPGNLPFNKKGDQDAYLVFTR